MRSFLGWDRPVLHAAGEVMVHGWTRGLLDLSGLMVVVPTRHSGRRLREHLAQLAAERDSAVVPPRVLTPEALLADARSEGRAADRFEALAVWADLLRRVDFDLFPDLFPVAPANPDFRWALATAEKFYGLQATLGEAGLDVLRIAGGGGEAELEEPERWAQLAELEKEFRRRLARFGLRDANEVKREAAKTLRCPRGITRIVVLAVPDPIPLALTALGTLSQSVPVEICVHAPPELADAFDEWGRPLVDRWGGTRIEIAEGSITLVGKPSGQAEEVMRLAGKLPFGARDLAIGVPAKESIPFVEKALLRGGVSSYNPAGLPLNMHSTVNLLTSMGELLCERDYEAFAGLARHPDYLRLLMRRDEAFRPDRFLRQLDQFQNDHLPHSFSDVAARVGGSDGHAGSELAVACEAVQGHLASMEDSGLAEGFGGFLAEAYEGIQLDRSSVHGRRFLAAADAVWQLFNQFEGRLFEELELSTSQRVVLLRKALSNLAFYPEREPGSVDLLGWLELHWEDAPCLIVAGMNDGVVPETIVADAFLPDTLLTRLGLKNNEMRLARDAYLLSAMIQSRRAGGEIRFVAGKTTSQGDPLKPSRLLFMCDDEQLPARTLKLFGDVSEHAAVVPRGIEWKLRPPQGRVPAAFSVTAFRDYLSCPFRFYLKRCLKMGAMDDRKSELDALQFGNLCHFALDRFGKSDSLRDSTDPDEIRQFLHAEASRWMRVRFGRKLSVPLLIQFDAARQRLAAAARRQAEDRESGWRIVHTEYRLGGGGGIELDGVLIVGTVDRLDRHESGQVRVIDYKTSDRDHSPESRHLKSAGDETRGYSLVSVAGREKRWVDLQLPLYRLLLEGEFGPNIVCGYFNLPKAVSKTGIALWEDLDRPLLDSARECARGVVSACRNREFLPTASRVLYDDYEGLFFDSAEEAVDWEFFASMLESSGEVAP